MTSKTFSLRHSPTGRLMHLLITPDCVTAYFYPKWMISYDVEYFYLFKSDSKQRFLFVCQCLMISTDRYYCLIDVYAGCK